MTLLTRKIEIYTHAGPSEALIQDATTDGMPLSTLRSQFTIYEPASDGSYLTYIPNNPQSTIKFLQTGKSYLVSNPSLTGSVDVNGYTNLSLTPTPPPAENFILCHENMQWRITPGSNTMQVKRRNDSEWTTISTPTAKALTINKLNGQTRVIMMTGIGLIYSSPVDAIDASGASFTQELVGGQNNIELGRLMMSADSLHILSGGGAVRTSGIGNEYVRSQDGQYDWGILANGKLACKRAQDTTPFETQWAPGGILELFISNHESGEPTWVYVTTDSGAKLRSQHFQLRIDSGMGGFTQNPVSQSDYNAAKAKAPRVRWLPSYNAIPTPTPTPTPTFDTTITANGASGVSSNGINFFASLNTQLLFNKIDAGGSTPARMEIAIAASVVGSATLLDRYIGQPFRFKDSNNVLRQGTFANGTVNPTSVT